MSVHESVRQHRDPARIVAKAKGEKRFISANPCEKGHTERYVRGGSCVLCARVRLAEYRQSERGRSILRKVWMRHRDKYPELRKASAAKYRRKKLNIPEATRPEPAACELCGLPPKSGRHLVIDHCHDSGIFRGWVCRNCNLGLGQFGDTIDGLMKAVRYLERVALEH